MKLKVGRLAILVLAMITPGAAGAGQTCVFRDSVYENLAGSYGLRILMPEVPSVGSFDFDLIPTAQAAGLRFSGSTYVMNGFPVILYGLSLVCDSLDAPKDKDFCKADNSLVDQGGRIYAFRATSGIDIEEMDVPSIEDPPAPYLLIPDLTHTIFAVERGYGVEGTRVGVRGDFFRYKSCVGQSSN